MRVIRDGLGVLVFAVILLIAIPALVFSSNDAEADTRFITPLEIIYIDDSEIFVDISASNDTIVNLTGYVKCYSTIFGDPYNDIVNLSCSVPGSYHSEVYPNSLVFSRRNTNQSFNVSVVIPRGTTSSISIYLNVSGIRTENGGNPQNLKNVTATIHVNQYYNFSLVSSKSELTVMEGDQFVFLVKVSNLGNGQDTLRLDIQNRAELEKKGVACMLSATDVILDEGNDSVVKISVTLPYDSDLRRINIHLTAYSFLSLYYYNTSVEQNLTLVVNVKSDYMPEMAIFCCIALPVIIIGSILSVVILAALERRKRKQR